MKLLKMFGIVFAIYRHQCMLCALNFVLIFECQRVYSINRSYHSRIISINSIKKESLSS